MDSPDADPIGVLAAAYGVRRNIDAVTDAIIKRTCTTRISGWKNEWRAFAHVVAIFIQDPRNIDRLKQGHRLPERYRRAMTQMVTVSVPAEDAEFFVDTVLADMASVLRGAVAVTTPSMTLPESSESPGPIQQMLGASALLAVLRRAAKRAEQDPRPQIAWSNGRIRALAALGTRLAEDGREDQGAATELRGKAGRHHADLTRAAALIRSRGSTKEDRIRNRANRLLLAAAANTALQPEAPEEAAVLDRLEQLHALSLPVGETGPPTTIQGQGAWGRLSPCATS